MPNSMQGPQSRENQTAITTGWIANAIVASLPVLACFLAGATQKWEEGVVITVLAFCLLVRPPRFSLGVITNLVLFTLLDRKSTRLNSSHSQISYAAFCL